LPVFGNVLSAPEAIRGVIDAMLPLFADFTLRLSSCRFHGASTSEISSRIGNSKKPSKTSCFQGLVDWLRG
jgi:hypothetical protein